MRNEQFEKELEIYYKKVRSLLVGSRKQKDKMMRALASDVSEFLAHSTTADMEEVQEHFGTPQKLGDEMLASMEPQELRRYIKRINAWNCFVLVFMAAVIVVVLSMQVQRILYAVRDRQNVTIQSADVLQTEDVPKHNTIWYVQE